jgi:hypothetical protein
MARISKCSQGCAQVRRPRVEELEPRVVLSASSERFVGAAYQALVGQPPPAARLAVLSNQLDQGVSNLEVVKEIINSPAYRRHQVDELYRHFLHRRPDRGGRAAAVHFLLKGGPVEQLETGILGSAEYARKRGGGSQLGFLSAVFHDVVGHRFDPRRVDPGVLQQQQGSDKAAPPLTIDPLASEALRRLRQGASNAEVAQFLVTSKEARQKLVQDFFQQFLGHAANAKQLRAEVAKLVKGAPQQRLIARLLSSPEFLAKLLPVVLNQPRVPVFRALDTQPPTVTLAPSGTLNTTFASFTVLFNEPMAASTFTAAAYTLALDGGPSDGQPVGITSVTAVTASTAQINLVAPLANQGYRFSISPLLTDLAGNPLAGPLTFHFSVVQPVRIAETTPANGDEGVGLARTAVVRFDAPIDPATIDTSSFFAIANGQRLDGTVRVSSTNTFATFVPTDPLPASTEVRVVVDGDKIKDPQGLPIDGTGTGVPGGQRTVEFTTLPLTRIAGTNLFGYVYDAYNKNPDGSNIPIVGATIRVDALPEANAVTDDTGFFELQDMPAPGFFVHVDGTTATNTPAGTVYPSVGKEFHDVPGQTVQLNMSGTPFNIYLPPMATGDVQPLSATTSTDVGFGAGGLAELHQMFPDVDPTMWSEVKVSFPPNSAIARDGTPATQAAVIPVPPDRLPAPLPPTVNPKLVISIQAMGATSFDVPAPAAFPNMEGLAPGEKALFWSFNHDAGRWEVIGTGTVSADGLTISTDPGVGIRAPGWHFVIKGSPGKFQVGVAASDPSNPLGPGNPDFDMSDGLFQQIDQKFNDLLNAIPNLISKIPGLGSFSDPFDLSPVETAIDTAIRGCYQAGALFDGADSGIVARYYERFLSGVGGRFTGESDILDLIGKDASVKANLQRYKQLIEPIVTSTIEADIDAVNGVLDLNKVRDDLAAKLNVPVDKPTFSTGTLKLVIDNTEAATLEVNQLRATGTITDPSVGGTGTWTAKLVYTVSDDFGFDPGDISRTFAKADQDLRDAASELGKAAQSDLKVAEDLLTLHPLDALADAREELSHLRAALADVKAWAGNFFGASCVAIFRYEQLHGKAKPFITDFPIDHTDNPDDNNLTGTFTIPPGFSDVVIIPDPPGGPGASGASAGAIPISTVPGFGQSNQLYYRFVLDNGIELAGVAADGQSVENLVLPPNEPFVATFYAPAINASTRLAGRAGASGVPTFFGKDPFDTSDTLGVLRLNTFGGPDSDGDGIPDVGEFAIGTDPNKADSDGDGISDAAEITQGLNPLDNRGFPTGVIASLPLAGTPEAVATDGNLVYIATGSNGLAIVNGQQFNTPVVLGQLPLSGNATDVGVDGSSKIAAVADGSSLQLVNVADPMSPTLARTVSVGADQVEVAGGFAFATSGNGLSVVDLLSGDVLRKVTLPGAGSVTGLARDGNFLYAFVSGSDTLAVIDISRPEVAAVVGQVGLSIASSDGGVFAGNGVVWLSGSGLRTVDVSNPTSPLVLGGPVSGSDFFNARRVALNGSGLALVTPDGGSTLSLYDASDPTRTGADRFLTAFNLSGSAHGLAISRGIAYVATDGGLDVVNYRPFDTQGVVPSVTLSADATDLDPATPGVQALEGTRVALRAATSDDVQVRSVELLVNGVVTEADVTYPFDFVITAPRIVAAGTTLTLQVRVTDTGGNATTSDPITLDVVPDTFPPTLVSIDPPDGTNRFEGSKTVRIRFSESLDPTSVAGGVFQLVEAGADGTFGTTDDTPVPVTVVSRDNDQLVQLTADALPVGKYQVRIDQAQVKDLSGNAFGTGTFTSAFGVLARPTVDNLFTLRGTPMASDFVLDGTDIKLGINHDGSFITQDRSVGLQFAGTDFLEPGVPLAGFTISHDDKNFTNEAPAGGSATPVMLQDLSSGTFHGMRAEGVVDGTLMLERVAVFNDGDQFITIATRLTNIGTTELTKVAWLENHDPDQGTPIGVGADTNNDVVLDGRLGIASVVNSNFPAGLTMGFGSVDPRATISIEQFFVHNPFDVIDSPEDPNGASGDNGLNIAFNFGALQPGESATGVFVLVLGRSTNEAVAVYQSSGL